MSLAVTGAVHNGELVGLRAENGMIVELGPRVQPQPGDDHIDAAGGILVPPLINGHTHAAMTLFRGYGDDLPLMDGSRRGSGRPRRSSSPRTCTGGRGSHASR